MAATAGAVAAGAALWTAKKANEAGQASAQAARSVEQIERDRWHRDLTPDLRPIYEPQEDLSVVLLRIVLDGPTALDGLDELQLSIRDDYPDRATRPITVRMGGPTEEQQRETIWGPYRLRTGKGVDRLGRSAAGQPLQRGEELLFWLEHTTGPAHGDSASWRTTHITGKPLRLAVHCRRAGYKPWYFPLVWLPQLQPDIKVLPPEPVATL